jgi:hypothetical protein
VPYRVAAPPPPDPPEEEDAYVTTLRRRERRARTLAVLGFVASGLGIASALARPAPAPSKARGVIEAERLDRARTALADARETARRTQETFEHAVRGAIGDDVVARPDLGPCPVRVPKPTSIGRSRTFPMLVLDRVEIAGALPSQSVAGVLADVRRAEVHAAAGRFEEASLYARALARPERYGWEVVLVARSSSKPKAVSGTAFEPGEIDGRAYLYDFGAREVVCAADVHVASSKAIGYTFSPASDAPPALAQQASLATAIDDDLHLQIARAVADAMLWRAGPASRGGAR